MPDPLLRAGDLRHRATIHSPTESRDEAGGVVVSWADEATVWALVEQTAGTEQYDAMQVREGASYRVLMRWRPGVTARQRLAWEGQILNITGVVADPLKTMLTIDCREGREE
jgi:SPP1 family predicted phage head-tail adaptor